MYTKMGILDDFDTKTGLELGAAGASGLIIGGIVGAVAANRSSKKKSKKRVSKRKSSKSRNHSRKKTRYPHTAGKRKDRSHKRIRFTKNGAPYIILKSGKARFIKMSTVKKARRRKGGMY